MFELFDVKGTGPIQIGAMALGALLVIAGGLDRIQPSGALALALVLGAMCAFMQFARSKIGLAGFLGLLLPAWCVAMLGELQVAHGFIWVLLVYATVEMNDAFAYVGGKLFGRTQLLPRLSPKKTLEGLIAGLIVGGGSGFLIGYELLHLSAGAALRVALVALDRGSAGRPAHVASEALAGEEGFSAAHGAAWWRARYLRFAADRHADRVSYA